MVYIIMLNCLLFPTFLELTPTACLNIQSMVYIDYDEWPSFYSWLYACMHTTAYNNNTYRELLCQSSCPD